MFVLQKFDNNSEEHCFNFYSTFEIFTPRKNIPVTRQNLRETRANTFSNLVATLITSYLFYFELKEQFTDSFAKKSIFQIYIVAVRISLSSSQDIMIHEYLRTMNLWPPGKSYHSSGSPEYYKFTSCLK